MKKITIIGAGIVGIATAAYLRRDGHEVTVIDRLPPGEYTSFGNAGNIVARIVRADCDARHHVESPGYLTDRWGRSKCAGRIFRRRCRGCSASLPVPRGATSRKPRTH
jgi:glycine/D-amino acid oxidase-like deaminating enzyme